LKPGDVVVGMLPGAVVSKVRPAVIIASDNYLRERPDVLVGVLTAKIPLTAMKRVSQSSQLTDCCSNEICTIPEIATAMFAILAKVFEIAESKYLSEHRNLLPQQLHRFALVRRDFDTSWIVLASGRRFDFAAQPEHPSRASKLHQALR
jgi:hypothetical protein